MDVPYAISVLYTHCPNATSGGAPSCETRIVAIAQSEPVLGFGLGHSYRLRLRHCECTLRLDHTNTYLFVTGHAANVDLHDHDDGCFE